MSKQLFISNCQGHLFIYHSKILVLYIQYYTYYITDCDTFAWKLVL